jgi:hypothetical protein
VLRAIGQEGNGKLIRTRSRPNEATGKRRNTGLLQAKMRYHAILPKSLGVAATAWAVGWFTVD